MSAVAVVAVGATKSIEKSREEIYALFGASGRGAMLWDSLPESTRAVLCRASGLKHRHINLPINKFNEFDRAQLLKSIKSLGAIAQEIKQLSSIPLFEFK